MTHAILSQREPDKSIAGMLPALCSAIAIAALTAAMVLALGLSLIWGLAAYSGTGALVLVIAGWQIGRHCPGCAS